MLLRMLERVIELEYLLFACLGQSLSDKQSHMPYTRLVIAVVFISKSNLFFASRFAWIFSYACRLFMISVDVYVMCLNDDGVIRKSLVASERNLISKVWRLIDEFFRKTFAIVATIDACTGRAHRKGAENYIFNQRSE